MRMRRRAIRALISHTKNAIRDLRNDEDEMLRGAPARVAPAFHWRCRICGHAHSCTGILMLEHVNLG